MTSKRRVGKEEEERINQELKGGKEKKRETNEKR